MPFITEEVYQEYFRKNEKDISIHISDWPKHEKEKISEELDVFYEVLTAIRQQKSIAQKSMKAEVVLTIEKEKQDALKSVMEDFMSVSCAKEIKEGKFNVEFVTN